MKTTLAERLKEAMAGPPKITGRTLATACNVSPPSVSDWLSGKSKTMEGSNLLAASDCLKVRAKWLADGVGPMRMDNPFKGRYEAKESTVNYLPDPKPDMLTAELLLLFSQLDEDSKRDYLIHLRGFVAGRRPHQDGDAPAMAG